MSTPSPTVQRTSAPDGVAGPVGDTYAAREMRATMTCLREAGWEVTYDPNTNTYGGSVPPEQQDAHIAAQEACNAEFAAGNPLRPLTDADYRTLYQQELVTRACLEKEGIPPVGAPISEQQYVDDYKAGRVPSWQAYKAVNLGTAEAMVQLEKKCPQPFVDQEASD